MHRYHSLDHWRGVACLLVILLHATFYAPTLVTSRMWVGVPFFFVISGYCIAAAADNTRARERSTLEYFKRRLRRIYPPFWAFLIVFVPFVGVLDLAWPDLMADEVHPIHRPWWLSAENVIGVATLTETWRPLVFGGRTHLFFGHEWTLCYEEQFYAIVGVALLVSRRYLFPLLAAVTVVVFGISLAGYDEHFRGSFLDGFWLDFAAGVGVYLCRTRTSAIAFAILAAGVIAWQFDVESLGKLDTTSNQYRVAAFAFAIALLALRPFDERIAAMRVLWPLQACGVMCYSLYLVHWPICKAISHAMHLAGVRGQAATLIVTFPVCLAASLAAGYAFHVAVERRFMSQQQREHEKKVMHVAASPEPAQESERDGIVTRSQPAT